MHKQVIPASDAMVKKAASESAEPQAKRTLKERVLAIDRAGWIKIAVALAFVVLIVVLVAVLQVQNDIDDLLEWIRDQDRALAALVVVAVYVVATVCFVPGSLLTIASGFIFGFGVGFLTVVIGATAGLCLAFLLGRYLVRDYVEKKAKENPKFKELDATIESEGWKVVLLVRLSPIVPFNALNYLLAFTSVTFRHYAVASFFGILPGTALFVYIGSLASDLGEITSGNAVDGTTTLIVSIVGGVVLILFVVFVTVLGKRALRRATEKAMRAMEDDNEAAAEAGAGLGDGDGDVELVGSEL